MSEQGLDILPGYRVERSQKWVKTMELSEQAITLVLIATDAIKTGRAIKRDGLEIMRVRMGIREDEMREVLLRIGEAHVQQIRQEYAS